MKNQIWMLASLLVLGLAAPASAQVVVSARFGRPWGYGLRHYAPPPRAYYAPLDYCAPPPVVVVPTPVVVYPTPVYYGPRFRPHGYGRGWRG